MNMKILVVDDDPRMLLALRTRLGGSFTLETARTAEVALEHIRNGGPYAVVISDLRMPGMGGAGLLEVLRHESPDTARILLSGISDPAEVRAAVHIGQPAHVLSKPFNARDLTRITQEALERYEAIKTEELAKDQERLRELEVLRSAIPIEYIPALFGESTRDDEPKQPVLLESDAMREIAVVDLRVGHRLLADLNTADGLKLMAAGHRINGKLRSRILHFAELVPIQEPLYVELLVDEDAPAMWRSTSSDGSPLSAGDADLRAQRGATRSRKRRGAGYL